MMADKQKGQMTLNRKQRRALAVEQRQFVAELPEALTLVPPGEIPILSTKSSLQPIRAWRSRRYGVQLYDESQRQPGMLRLSICRATRKNGQWEDGITWDELQAIKREVGYGDWYAVEVYPPDREVVHVANFRHLWLLETPLPIGF